MRGLSVSLITSLLAFVAWCSFAHPPSLVFIDRFSFDWLKVMFIWSIVHYFDHISLNPRSRASILGVSLLLSFILSYLECQIHRGMSYPIEIPYWLALMLCAMVIEDTVPITRIMQDVWLALVNQLKQVDEVK
jgi:hypothetical protein